MEILNLQRPGPPVLYNWMVSVIGGGWYARLQPAGVVDSVSTGVGIDFRVDTYFHRVWLEWELFCSSLYSTQLWSSFCVGIHSGCINVAVGYFKGRVY